MQPLARRLPPPPPRRRWQHSALLWWGSAAAVGVLWFLWHHYWARRRRSPPPPRERPPPLLAAAAASGRPAAAVAAAALPMHGAPARVAAELPTSGPLQQIRGRKLSLCTASILFVSPSVSGADSSSDGVEKLQVDTEALVTAMQIASCCDLYVIHQCDSDSAEAAAAAALEPLFSSGLNRSKLLFSSSAEGRGHMVRHLEPYLHIDSNRAVIAALQPHVPQLVIIDGAASADGGKGRRGLTEAASLRALWTPAE